VWKIAAYYNAVCIWVVRCTISSMIDSTTSLPTLSAQDRARRIKVLLYDVDGVLTNGDITIIPQEDGSAVEVKSFSAHDGMGIGIARLAGLKIGFVTKRNSKVVAIRARDLKIDHVYQGQSHKMEAVEKILAAENCTLDEIAYVGDDIIDLPVMRRVGLAIATANARTQAKAAAHYITPLPGGQGAGRDAIDFILSARGVLDQTIEQYLDPKNAAAGNADIGVGNM
jgi:3-deoxy-D-manno-octulosonate 8-phosphate phosphatase (KDO 8-P phosphatase)